SESVLASGCRELRIECQSVLHHSPPLHKIIPRPAPAKLQPSLVVFVRLSVVGRTIAVAEPGSGGGFRRSVRLLETQPGNGRRERQRPCSPQPAPSRRRN